MSIDSAPLARPDWAAVLTAGMAAQGMPVTVSCAAPLTCNTWECVCPDGTHLWLTPATQTGASTRDGGQG